MIALKKIHGHTSSKIDAFETFAAAVAAAKARYKIEFFEVDEDHEDAADFLTKDGQQFVIQPA